MTRGGGVWKTPKLADMICEQPLIAAQFGGRQENVFAPVKRPNITA